MSALPAVFIAFALMAASDLLKLRKAESSGKTLLAGGFITLLAALTASALRGSRFSVPLPLRLVFLVSAAFGACGEYMALFGALPVKSVYLSPSAGPRLVESGLYGLCRHPGGLFFPLMTLSLALALGSAGLLAAAAAASFLNLLYILFQDRLIFPKTIPGYDRYRQKVPFLFPARAALRAQLKKRLGGRAKHEIQ